MIKIYVTRCEQRLNGLQRQGYKFERGEFVTFHDMYVWRRDTGFRINTPTHGPNSSIMQFPDEYEFGLFCIKHGVTSPSMKEAPYARL